MLHQLQHCLHYVRDVSETATLRSIAVYGQRLVPDSLSHQSRNDHAVVSSLTRTHGVEEPNHRDGQIVLPIVRKREKLVHHLARRVAPTALLSGAEQDVVGLAERDPCAFSIYFRRTGNEHPAAVS